MGGMTCRLCCPEHCWVREKSRSNPIKTERQYRYLNDLQRLVPLDPDSRTADGARLKLLAKLVEDYEKERFKFAPAVEIYGRKRIRDASTAESRRLRPE